jgi:Zn finger protein HypA/HybF involved in hydrogenase expression
MTDFKNEAEKICIRYYDIFVSDGYRDIIQDIESALIKADEEGFKRGRESMREECISTLEEMARCECPECGGVGWYAQQVSDTEQEQRRCENCYDGIVSVDEVMLKPTVEAIRKIKA